jgi:ABC-2 type transport system permease protein
MKIFSLSLRNLKEIYRDPISILLGLGMPVALLILFSSINKKVPLEIFSPQSLTPGIIIFCFAFLIMFSAILLAKDRQTAFLTRLFTTPLKSTDFIFSYTLPFLPLSLFQISICLIVGLILGAVFKNLILACLIFLLVALICVSIGMILGTFLTVNQVSGVGSVLITAIALFSGAWMDLKMIGGFFETLGYALPFAHAVDASKGLLLGTGFSKVLTDFYIILFYAIVLFIFAILSFRLRMKKT